MVAISYRTSPRRHDAFRDLRFFTFTFLAGHLAFQVHATKWASLHNLGNPLPPVEFETQWDTRTTTEFWPDRYGFPVEWPPAALLAYQAAQ